MANDDDFALYNYDPSVAASVIFSLVFAISAVVHIWHAFFKARAWFFTAFIIGSIMMTAGYISRAISAKSPESLAPYISQSLLILLPPSLYAATIYMLYGRIVHCTKRADLSIISPTKVTKIFVVGDVIAFLLQCSGGGLMAISGLSSTGQKVIVFGLFFQLLFFGFFLYVSVKFALRIRQAQGGFLGAPWGTLLHILFLMSSLIIFRCVYRVVEFLQGHDGYLISREVYMYLFDTLPMLVVQLLFHYWKPYKMLDYAALGKTPSFVNLHDMR
ncbi:Pc21g00660 [Penicillium rubens Wisconsin 54-1255]|uniref:Pc21g00660 protein n=1 Tax=Penicillium rubens (strain ATCC 28089 / DSM 1075 / NRRL 1951 / Wisconsin 54-1255) TaxID=500485 RepID=B6HNJ7_PENRW|nr:Pc21g00660 [Penicillium rubens Wisconsin 54-1255]